MLFFDLWFCVVVTVIIKTLGEISIIETIKHIINNDDIYTIDGFDVTISE